MKLIEVVIKSSEQSVFIKTDATNEAVESAIRFIPDTDVEKLLGAIRIQGYKATEVKLNPVEIFEM